MTVITGAEALAIRNTFLEVYIDKSSPFYHNIRKQVRDSGGRYYFGYLWDCLIRRNLKIVTYNTVLQLLKTRKEFFVFWDNHPRAYFTANNPAWSYPQNALLMLSENELENILPVLPEDCYFFDDSLSWAISLTHEESKPGRRICYYLTK